MTDKVKHDRNQLNYYFRASAPLGVRLFYLSESMDSSHTLTKEKATHNWLVEGNFIFTNII